MKNPKSFICLTFGVLFFLAALILYGTKNGELVISSILAGFFLLIASCLMHKNPDDEDEDDE